MKVYLVGYEEQGHFYNITVGVYSTLEAAEKALAYAASKYWAAQAYGYINELEVWNHFSPYNNITAQAKVDLKDRKAS